MAFWFICKEILIGHVFFFILKKKKTAVELWTAMFYILQAKKKKLKKNKNLTYLSLWWASLSPNLLMFILVLSLNAMFNS